jgi:3-methylfumaryl-CoA hydratase
LISSADTTIQRVEMCTVATARRIAAMLDMDPDRIAEGDVLPRGWQFVLLAADIRRSMLRADGFPGPGVPMPEVGIPRLVLGGRAVSFRGDIPIGAKLLRSSCVDRIETKSTGSESMAIVRILHELRLAAAAEPVLVESQTYLLLPARSSAPDGQEGRSAMPSAAHRTTTLIPDETLLFQYSALGFNSHRIHLDRTYTREVEGFPDLVVNGGLATLLLTEMLRRDLGVVPVELKVRHIAPLYCRRPMTLAANRLGARWSLQAFDDRQLLAVDMEVGAE